MSEPRMRPMWTCPECGRQYANRNQWHSCVHLDEADHLAKQTEHAKTLYRALKAEVGAWGPFRVHAQKTRIAFISRMSFAGATLQKRWITVGLILPREVESTRFHKIERYGPRSVGHYLKLHSLDDLDDEVRAWLGEAYRVGMQEEQPRYHESS